MDRRYMEEGGGEGGREMEKREMVKGFRYGDVYLPVDSTAERRLKLEGREGGREGGGEGRGGTVVEMRVLGMLPSVVVPRHHAMGNVSVVKAHKDEQEGGGQPPSFLCWGRH